MSDEQTPDRDPEIQRLFDVAVRELARRLDPWGALQDPHMFATRFMEDLYREANWRPIPRPLPLRDRRPGTPPPADWRDAADRIRRTPRGDQ